MSSDLRLLVLGDIHASVEAISTIVAAVHAGRTRYDAVVCVGDLGTEVLPGNGEHSVALRARLYDVSVDAVFACLRMLRLPILFVPGNHDRPGLAVGSGATGIDLLGGASPVAMAGWTICGLGGSPRTPGRFPYEWDDADRCKDVCRAIPPCDRLILVSHAPPIGRRCDLGISGQHFGSRAVRRVIGDKAPRAVLCGHIHEALGCEFVESTMVLNAGTADTVRELRAGGPGAGGIRGERFRVASYLAVSLSDSGFTATNHIVLPGANQASVRPIVLCARSKTSPVYLS